MKIYYDGSNGEPDPQGDGWITLGGVAATDAVWADFDLKWNRMLRERYPMAPYIHMIELLDHNSPFDRVNGWTREKKRQLISDAIVVLSQMHKQEFRWFRCSLNTSAIERLFMQGKVVPSNPHLHIALFMLYLMVTGYADNVNINDREKIFVFYDRGEKFYPLVKKAWLEGRTMPGQPLNPSNPWDFLENIAEVDQAYTPPPLQVADMVAWSHTRTLTTSEERDFSYLKSLFLKFAPSSTVDVTEQVLRQQSELIRQAMPNGNAALTETG
jgi:hypothetical protein